MLAIAHIELGSDLDEDDPLAIVAIRVERDIGRLRVDDDRVQDRVGLVLEVLGDRVYVLLRTHPVPVRLLRQRIPGRRLIDEPDHRASGPGGHVHVALAHTERRARQMDVHHCPFNCDGVKMIPPDIAYYARFQT